MKIATLPRKLRKAYAVGGVLNPNDPTQRAAISTQSKGLSPGTIGAIGGTVNSLVDAWDPGNARGHQSQGSMAVKGAASGASTGAAIGSVIPGVGTLAGGVVGGAIGLTSGLINGAGQSAQDRALDRYDQYRTNNYQIAQGQARVAQDPSLIYGQRGAQVFADGGQLPGPNQQRRPIQLKQVNIHARLPVITHNPKDPRLKAYNDSLFLYNETNAYRDKIVKSGLYRPKTDVYPIAPEDRPTPKSDGTFTVNDASDPKLYKTNTWQSLMANVPGLRKVTMHEKKGIAPVNDEFFTRKESAPGATPTGGKGEWYGDSIENYKKPTQPVIYRPPVPKVVHKKVVPTAQPATASQDVQIPTILTHDSLMHVQKRDGSIGQWGNDLPPATPTPIPMSPGSPTIVPSDKAKGAANTYYRSDANAKLPTPAVQRKSTNYGSHYQLGGMIKAYGDGGSIHIDPKNKGKFTAWASAHDMSVQEAASHVMAHKDEYSRTVVKRANFAKNFGGHKAYGGSLDSDDTLVRQQVPGGSLQDMNSHAVEVSGDSHEQGGVQLPQAEVEGGETISNGFVFSDELGFAKLHKPIAKAMGKLEDKPMNPIRRRTMAVLQEREQGLMLSQEFLKQRLGIPSDLNT